MLPVDQMTGNVASYVAIGIIYILAILIALVQAR